MATRRTQEEIQSLLDGYRRRTVTRAEYCHQQGVATSTLDNYRRRYDGKPTRFARVKITAQASESRMACCARSLSRRFVTLFGEGADDE
jgi:hypothetical protein